VNERQVAVVTDSAADLGPAAAENAIEVVPLTVRFGSEEFRDGVDLSADDFYRKLETSGTTPITAAPAPSAFAAIYRRLLERPHARVISIHLAESLSGTFNAARLAATEVDASRISVIDSRTASAGVGLLVLDAARRARAGESAEAIDAAIRSDIPKVSLYATIPSLTYLARGGRIGQLSGMVGNVLKIVPILTLSDGIIREFAKVRTFARAVDQMIDVVVAKLKDAADVRFAVLHSMAPDLAESVAARLRAALRPASLYISSVGPTVGTHAGPGAVGITYIA
jgi:DegV family protein with EDD domain